MNAAGDEHERRQHTTMSVAVPLVELVLHTHQESPTTGNDESIHENPDLPAIADIEIASSSPLYSDTSSASTRSSSRRVLSTSPALAGILRVAGRDSTSWANWSYIWSNAG